MAAEQAPWIPPFHPSDDLPLASEERFLSHPYDAHIKHRRTLLTTWCALPQEQAIAFTLA